MRNAARERTLVERCLRSDRFAWEELYTSFSSSVVWSVRRLLGFPKSGQDLAEDVAAQTWFRLIVTGGRALRAFDPERGSLKRYLGLLARHELYRHQRSQRQGLGRLQRQPLAMDIPERRDRGAEEDRLFDAMLGAASPRDHALIWTVLLGDRLSVAERKRKQRLRPFVERFLNS